MAATIMAKIAFTSFKKNETSACVKIKKKTPCTIVDIGFKYSSVVKIIQAMSWRQRGKSSNGHHLTTTKNCVHACAPPSTPTGPVVSGITGYRDA